MASQTELTTAKSLTAPLESETLPASADAPKIRTAASQMLGGIKHFLIYVTVVALLCTVGKWALFSATKSNTVADCFLWAAGSDKTWEEYQRDHVRKGHSRMEDKDATWLEQLFIDGYAGRND